MIKHIGRAVRFFSQKSYFVFSEGRMALKREGESKLALKIKESLNTSYIKVDDITIGTNSCKHYLIQADRCTTSLSSPKTSEERVWCNSIKW
jgi:hypothetical protein